MEQAKSAYGTRSWGRGLPPKARAAVGFPSSEQGMSSGKRVREAWRAGFPEEVSLEKWMELKEMGSWHVPEEAHTISKGPEVSTNSMA